MHYFVDDPSRQRLDRNLLIGTQLPQPPPHAVNLRLPDRLQVILQRHDRRNDIERVYPRLKTLDFTRDNRFRELGFLPPVSDVAANRLLQAADAVRNYYVQLRLLRRNY